MARNAIFVAVVALACWASGPVAADPRAVPAGETELRQSMQEALWPADIAAVSADYLRRYPTGAWSDAARTLYERSQLSARILARNDVRLYRSAFHALAGHPQYGEDLRKAALADRDAARRLALVYQTLAPRSAMDTGRYVGWLQFAAQLGSQESAYDLAVYYRRADQPALASQYEAKAVSMGYVLPTVLDHVRK